MNIFISSYDNDKTVTVCNLNKVGKLQEISKVNNLSYPSYLKKREKELYVSLKKENENSIGGILNYEILNNGLKNEKLYQSDSSFTHLFVDEKYIIGASYHQGLVEIFDKNKKFNIVRKYANSKIHNVGYIDRIQKYYAVDLNNDSIYFFKIENEKIVEEETVKLNKGDGPRHIWYTSMNRYIYVVNEISSTIVVLDIEKNFEIIQRISTIENRNIKNNASAIMSDKNNKFLYVSNRGADNIAIYKINYLTGFLEYQFSINDICCTPRDFFINKDIMLIANQDSDTLISLKLDIAKKHFNIVDKLNIKKPVCIEI